MSYPNVSPSCGFVATNRDCVHRSVVDYLHPLTFAGGLLFYIISYYIAGVLFQNNLPQETIRMFAILFSYIVASIFLIILGTFIYKRFAAKGQTAESAANAHANIMIDLMLVTFGIIVGYFIDDLVTNLIVLGVVGIISVTVIIITIWRR